MRYVSLLIALFAVLNNLYSMSTECARLFSKWRKLKYCWSWESWGCYTFFSQLAFSNTSSRCEGFCNMFCDKSLFWDPKPITFKTRLSPKPFLWNEFYLYESKKLTWIEPRFKTEAWGDSKMAYSICWWFVFAVNGNSIENCQKAVLILPFAIVFLHSHCRLWCFSF